MYKVEHYDGKGRVAEWMKAQVSDTSSDGMTWSVVTSGPYMDMLNIVRENLRIVAKVALTKRRRLCSDHWTNERTAHSSSRPPSAMGTSPWSPYLISVSLPATLSTTARRYQERIWKSRVRWSTGTAQRASSRRSSVWPARRPYSCVRQWTSGWTTWTTPTSLLRWIWRRAAHHGRQISRESSTYCALRCQCADRHFVVRSGASGGTASLLGIWIGSGRSIPMVKRLKFGCV